jgi:hypothetical protein
MKGLRWTSEKGEDWETVEIPDDLKETALEWRHKLYEQLADHHEELMASYVEGHEPEPAQLLDDDRLGGRQLEADLRPGVEPASDGDDLRQSGRRHGQERGRLRDQPRPRALRICSAWSAECRA